MGAAANAGDLANATNVLAGVEGYNFTYKPKKSAMVIKLDGKDLNILANLQCKDKTSALSILKVCASRFPTLTAACASFRQRLCSSTPKRPVMPQRKVTSHLAIKPTVTTALYLPFQHQN